ncbi:hypothetical protein DPMN_163297 [Dreissena polymorpha]|uniref:Uncharacterized protein n=1 Tax=Dreissena polymorpha TaxID=45954 RepID=A0A9D4IUG4_DREPO|nr:hypothetical protein DPMN_163297 [Dreissena polymorpha]
MLMCSCVAVKPAVSGENPVSNPPSKLTSVGVLPNIIRLISVLLLYFNLSRGCHRPRLRRRHFHRRRKHPGRRVCSRHGVPGDEPPPLTDAGKSKLLQDQVERYRKLLRRRQRLRNRLHGKTSDNDEGDDDDGAR